MMQAMPLQNIVAQRAGLPGGSLPMRPGAGNFLAGQPGAVPPQQMMTTPTIAPEGTGMVPPDAMPMTPPPGALPPGAMPMNPGGPVSGAMPMRPGMPNMLQRPMMPPGGPMAAQNFMRARMGIA